MYYNQNTIRRTNVRRHFLLNRKLKSINQFKIHWLKYIMHQNVFEYLFVDIFIFIICVIQSGISRTYESSNVFRFFVIFSHHKINIFGVAKNLHEYFGDKLFLFMATSCGVLFLSFFALFKIFVFSLF